MKKKKRIAGMEDVAMEVGELVLPGGGMIAAYELKGFILPKLLDGKDEGTQKTIKMVYNLGAAVATGGLVFLLPKGSDERRMVKSFASGAVGFSLFSLYMTWRNADGTAPAVAGDEWTGRPYKEIGKKLNRKRVGSPDQATSGLMGADQASNGLMGPYLKAGIHVPGL